MDWGDVPPFPPLTLCLAMSLLVASAFHLDAPLLLLAQGVGVMGLNLATSCWQAMLQLMLPPVLSRVPCPLSAGGRGVEVHQGPICNHTN